ncbi:MAG TPA: glycosyltransferase family 87 protein [Candidatus Dormibacteraeota bacterium]
MRRVLGERGYQLAGLLALLGLTVLAVRNLVGWISFALRRAFEGDFAAYYAFTRIGLHAGFSHLYDVAAQRQEWQALGPLLWYPAVYPPWLALDFAPLALLPFPVAYAVWNVLLGAALVLTWWLLAPGSRWQRGLQLAAALAIPLVAFSLLLGQVVMVVGAALAVAWWCLRRGSPELAGVVLSLILLKPQLALLVPLALLASLRFRPAAAFVAASVAIGLVTVATVGLSGIAAYAARLQNATHSLDFYQVPSALTLPGLLGHGLLAVIGQMVVVGVVVVAAFAQRARGPQWPIAIGVIGSLLVTPFYHPDDVAILLPAAWLWMRTAPARLERVLMAVGFSGALLLGTPLPLLLCLGAMLLPRVDLLFLNRAPARPNQATAVG